MVHFQLGQRIHFYYCVLVALKINVKSGKFSSARNKNNFLLNWLKSAEANRLFSEPVEAEIRWLRGKILKTGVETDLEPMLEFIYTSATKSRR